MSGDLVEAQPDEVAGKTEEQSAAGPQESGVLEEPENSPDGGLEARLDRLDSRLEESQRLLSRQSELIDRLHGENQDLRAGELRSAQLPLVRDLLRLHDDVGRMRSAAGEFADDLRVVQESLADTLARNGIESLLPALGEPFDPRLQSATGVEVTDDESLDKGVAEVVRQGFRWDSGDVIRVAEVRVYRHMGTG